MLEMIAFDADDTLWHNEVHYQDAQAELIQILTRWASSTTIENNLNKIEMQNLKLYGYGVKAFMLSMIETALQVSAGEIEGKSFEKILSIGRNMLQAEVTPLPNVAETLQVLAKTHRLMVITKGDVLDQTNKVTRSGLADYFSLVEVVSEKTAPAYQQIFEKYLLDPEMFLMAGNSLRSDVLPILELGGKAVHIPANTTWAHEMVPDFDASQPGYYKLDHLGQLPSLVSKLAKMT